MWHNVKRRIFLQGSYRFTLQLRHAFVSASVPASPPSSASSFAPSSASVPSFVSAPTLLFCLHLHFPMIPTLLVPLYLYLILHLLCFCCASTSLRFCCRSCCYIGLDLLLSEQAATSACAFPSACSLACAHRSVSAPLLLLAVCLSLQCLLLHLLLHLLVPLLLSLYLPLCSPLYVLLQSLLLHLRLCLCS
jgi:hypothetical protein